MFGDVLKSARKKAGMTQEELAFASGLDRTYISRLERNKKSPTLNTLLQLADSLGVPAASLVARVERLRKKGK